MKSSRTRFRVLALISAGTMINYLDRTVLGVAAPSLSTDLHISPAVMGIVFSAFSWSYAAAQIPGGWVLDRIGTRVTYFLSAALWSLFTLVQGFAGGISSLLVFRLGLGIAEAPCFPANSRAVGEWFPEQERAKATAVYVGEYLGLACFGPVLFWLSRSTAGARFSGWWALPAPCSPASGGCCTRTGRRRTAPHESPGNRWEQVRQLRLPAV